MDTLFDCNNYWAAALNFIRNNFTDNFIFPSFLIFFCFLSNTSFSFSPILFHVFHFLCYSHLFSPSFLPVICDTLRQWTVLNPRTLTVIRYILDYRVTTSVISEHCTCLRKRRDIPCILNKGFIIVYADFHTCDITSNMEAVRFIHDMWLG